MQLKVRYAGGREGTHPSCLYRTRHAQILISHRSHHRYTDTDFDPYNSSRGLLWTHIGWMVVKTDIHAGKVDVSDLEKDAITRWQHRHYFLLMVVFGFLLPTLVPALLWDDFTGGFCIAACLRLTVAHHVRLVRLFFVRTGSHVVRARSASTR